jgi:hypothetical protein
MCSDIFNDLDAQRETIKSAVGKNNVESVKKRWLTAESFTSR